ncbi:MAG: matrixin family metalloprotease [Myxococcota bacterium]
MLHSRTMTAGLMVLGLTGAGTASGYALLSGNWSWQTGPMNEPFYLNPTSFPASVGAQADVETALTNSLERWGLEGGANFAFTNGGFTTNTSWASDGLHVAQWRNATTNGGTLATAQSYYAGYGMTDCDIRVWAANGSGPINWSSSPSGANFNQIDLEQTLTHEFGHCAGLAHSGSSTAMMAPFAIPGAGPAERLLTPDDQAGLQAMYGVAVGLDLNLSVLDLLVVGQPATVMASGVDPGRTVYFIYTFSGEGAGVCPPALGGECVGLVNPIGFAGSAVANSAGEAGISLNPPASLAGLTVSFQAVDVYGASTPALVSNAATATVLAALPSCPAGETPDCNGSCYNSNWVGDGTCDDGTTYAYGSPDFFCGAFTFDGGDCGP